MCTAFIILTVHVFTNVSHPWGGSRGHVSPLEISLKDHGVVDHHRLREIVSGQGGGGRGWEILVHHSRTISPRPSAVFRFSANEPSITTTVLKWKNILFFKDSF